MHRRWKAKQIPIRRTVHAANKGMHPFAHADDVGTHVVFACLFILRLPTQGASNGFFLLLSLMRLLWLGYLFLIDLFFTVCIGLMQGTLSVFVRFVPFGKDAVVDHDRIFPCFNTC